MKDSPYIFLFRGIFCILIALLVFGVWFHYCYAIGAESNHPFFKETLPMLLSFLGSFGTLVSIGFAFWAYIKQKEKEESDAKELILHNKPKITISAEKTYCSEDGNQQPALAVDLIIKNYLNDAYSFGLADKNLPDRHPHLLIEFKKNDASSTLKVDETHAITIIISLEKDVINPPKLDDVEIYIRAVYFDRLGNIFEDYYILQKSKRGEHLEIKKTTKSEVLTASGKAIELINS